MNENSDEDKDEDESWESNIMLKDNRWSVSKGINNRKEEKSLTTAPLIIRHNNVNKKVTSNLITTAQNLFDEESDELMEDLEDLEDGRTGDSIDEVTQHKKPIESMLKSTISVECYKMNESTFRGKRENFHEKSESLTQPPKYSQNDI